MAVQVVSSLQCLPLPLCLSFTWLGHCEHLFCEPVRNRSSSATAKFLFIFSTLEAKEERMEEQAEEGPRLSGHSSLLVYTEKGNRFK